MLEFFKKLFSSTPAETPAPYKVETPAPKVSEFPFPEAKAVKKPAVKKPAVTAKAPRKSRAPKA